MLQNYIKIAWRNLRKNTTFSFINIAGLSIGFTCCLLIAIYLQHELSYDSYHKNVRQLYQLGTVFISGEKQELEATSPLIMGTTMQQVFPEIEKTARLLKLYEDDKTLLLYKTPNGTQQSFYESNGFIADSTFFQLLTYRFTEGNPATAMTEPNSVVLSKEIATKMFGKETALNRIIHISSNTNGDHDFKVTGVFEPSALPSHINGRFFMSLKGGDVDAFLRSRRANLSNNNMFHTYLQLRPGADAAKLEAKFPAFIEKYAGAELRAMGFYKKQFLIPVKDIHLYNPAVVNVTPGASITYLYILASVAVFTLLIACINFMNLSTARSSKRSAEVGVRKVLGAAKGSLMKLFLGESVLLSLLAFVLAILIALLLLPWFAKTSGQALTISWQMHGWLLVAFFGLAVITGMLAGIYPAFYLSSFKPVKVLKGRLTHTLASISLRRALVVFQFVISAVLIIASVVISNQMQFLRSKDLGFAKDQQIIIPMRSHTTKEQYASLKNELGRIPQLQSIGASTNYPGIFNPMDMPLYKEGASMNESKRVALNKIDDHFLQTLNIQLIAGRHFSKDVITDTTERLILNETAIKQLGFRNAQEAADKKLYIDFQGRTYDFYILGVVKDFHFKDLHSPIEPFGFRLSNDNQFNYIIAHAVPGHISHTLNAVQAAWHKLNPNEPFEYSFLDQDFQKNYEAESRLSSLVSYFTVVAILISCLGLFGLATFSVEQRTKEIGIRKVLGAGMLNITTLLSKDFIKPVLMAIVIASPLAWYVMQKWLQDFAYRISITWWMFAIAGLMAVLIALITVSFQAIKAAIANPVKTLRTE